MLNHFVIQNSNDVFERIEERSLIRRPFYSIRKRKTRWLVQKGLENIVLKLEDIVLFYTENKIVYVIDRSGKKYLTDNNLLELENELDELTFFRANRQHIININFIKSFRSYEKVKIRIDMAIAELNHCIIVSQETAPYFRKWINEA